jgi:alpha-mannosidase
MKKCEDDDSTVLRFYEGEGRAVKARVRMPQPIQQAWKTNLVEEEPESLPLAADGAVELEVGPWEIVTMKVV